jgi:ABC-type polysaccharide/polyol phosphate export permease
LLAPDLPIELLAALPIACSLLTVIGSGAGLLLSPYVTVVKDLSKFVSYVLFLSFFLQCVLYPYSLTVGHHRLVLTWLPHTIVVEWCRAVASNGSSPFSLEHSIIVFAIWSIPMLYGFIRYDYYRWRSTTWS